jgi:hypothetical protein
MNYAAPIQTTSASATAATQSLICPPGTMNPLQRVNYFNRQLLTADDMATEQNYFLEKMRRHNRFLHGWGVVCGLAVTASPTAALPWQVQIWPGYALGPYGDEIFVGEAVLLDLAKCGPGAATDPCEPNQIGKGTGGVGATVYVAIRYAECLARPVLSMPPGCGCDDTCEFSRICDSFEIQCLTQLPPNPVGPTMCDILDRNIPLLCPGCPSEPWVVLATVVLPDSSSGNVTNIDDRAHRRFVFSTYALQEQLIACCCGQDRTLSSAVSSSSSGSTSGTIP